MTENEPSALKEHGLADVTQRYIKHLVESAAAANRRADALGSENKRLRETLSTVATAAKVPDGIPDDEIPPLFGGAFEFLRNIALSALSPALSKER